MKKFLLLITLFSPLAVINANADDINDQNTPLHLMQPQYVTPYGIPAEADVKSTIDRVLAYLETAMPAKAVIRIIGHSGLSISEASPISNLKYFC